MAALSYLDASAIVKLVVREAETAALETDLAGREGLVSSRLSVTETSRAAARSGSPRAAERLDEAFDALYLLDVTADILHHASAIGPTQLRTGDAIHIATALAVADPDLEFVTYDERLAGAARAAGLRVVQPGYPPRNI